MTGRACSVISLWLGRYSIVIELWAALVGLFTILRVLMLAFHFEGTPLTLAELFRVFFVGLRLDLLVGLLLVLPQIIGMTIRTNRSTSGRVFQVTTDVTTFVTVCLIACLCCVEFVFFDEYTSRLNYIAFEYLAYPTEVFGNIWESYPVIPIFLGVGVVATGVYMLLRRRVAAMLAIPLPWPRRYGFLAATLAILAGLRLTTNMLSIDITENRVANECAGNGLYSFVHYAWTSRFDYEHFYETIDLNEAYARVRRRIADPSDVFHSSSPNPLDRTVRSTRPQRDYNVVLILEESFGSDFVGVLGDTRQLTPHFDQLAKDGILFDNFYATGNRTARALEATLASLPPIPTEAILKRTHNDRVFTLARLLADRGYRRLFVSGGRGMFDGMRPFAMQNGFERFVELKDFEEPIFVNAWGVCDEDTFARSLDEFDALARQGEPFFGLVLTVTNHPPFTFPEGRIEMVRGKDGDRRGRLCAVRYADWALGWFIERARSRDFYKNTVFVVMGDHGARVYGADLFPIKSYRVPVLMILPDGQGAGTRCSTLASSIDIAPTIMGILGGSYRSVLFGRDALRIDPDTGYALMQHNHDLALLDSNHRMITLDCPQTVHGFQLHSASMSLTLTVNPTADLVADTVAFYQAGDQIYYDENHFPAAADSSKTADRR